MNEFNKENILHWLGENIPDKEKELSKAEVLEWMHKNLVSSAEIAQITGKMQNTVDQAIKTGLLPTFFEKPVGKSSKLRLFLREDAEKYKFMKTGANKGMRKIIRQQEEE